MLQAQAQTLQLALETHLVTTLDAATFTPTPAACPKLPDLAAVAVFITWKSSSVSASLHY